jgi:stage II sporulation protein D
VAFLAHAQQPGEIRVGLGWLALPQETTITPGGGGATLSRCSGCPAVQLRSPATFTVRGSSLLDSAGKTFAGPVNLEGDYTISFAGRAPLRIRFPATMRAHHGGIRIVLRIPLEEYVALALAGESSDFTSEAALQAMAVTVRTYAVNQRGRHAKEGFDLCDSTHCQLLRFDVTPSELIRAAAGATEGELLWYRGEPAAAYYSGNCAGTTEDGAKVWPALAAPYLRGHADPYCVVHGRSEWTAEIAADDMARALREAGWNAAGERVTALRVLERTASGRVSRIEIFGSSPFVAGAEEFRAAINRAMGSARLRSNFYDVREASGRFVFHGYGLGHGAGLCQAGAEEMGAEGKSYREILAFYYPGTAVGLTAQGLDWSALHGERIDLLTTQPDADRTLLPHAESLLRAVEQQTGWSLAAHAQLRVYPTVAVYRNATAAPGWVAGNTKGRIIRIEPPAVLRAAGALDSTLRHEFLHILVESRARAGLPLWFREGLVLYLGNEQRQAKPSSAPAERIDFAALEENLVWPKSATAAQSAYRQAQRAVAQLVATRGRGEVLSWVERGLPGDVAAQR